MENRSRLSKRLERKTRLNILLTIGAILLIIIGVLKFGLPLLINATLFIGSKNDKSIPKEDSSSFVQPPMLNPTFEATNSAQITISGIASSDETISLYINDEKTDESSVKKDNSFRFEDITLSSGKNVINAIATTKNGKKSTFSNQLTIVYKKSAPALTISSPSDGQSFSKDDSPITVSGKTDPGVKVTVNNFWAIVDANGNFSYNLRIQNGENHIKISGIDAAGNTTEKELKVNYSQ